MKRPKAGGLRSRAQEIGVPTRAGSVRPPVLGAMLALWVGTLSGEVAAQVVLDPAFSTETVTAGEYAPGLTTDYLIQESYGQREGANLFHRFSRFDVAAGQSATFVETLPGSGIARVFSYVDSVEASTLGGTLRSTIEGADLYFVNPRGVLFGPNAELDVLGSFRASSADLVRFADGARFGRVESGAPAVTLSAAAPVAWGFLSTAPAALRVTGASLEVPEGEALSLVGGPIEIVGAGGVGDPTVFAPGGRVELVAVASPGEVPLSQAEAPDLGDFSNLAPINLRGGATVDVSGTRSESIVVRGESLVLEDAALVANHSGPLAHGGDAIDIAVRGEVRLGDPATGSIGTLESLVVRGPGEAESEQGGAGGNIRIDAGESIRISGEQGATGRSLLSAGSVCTSAVCAPVNQPTAEGGDIVLSAPTVALRDGGWIVNQNGGTARGGGIEIDATVVSVGNAAETTPGTPTFIGTGAFGTSPVSGAATSDPGGEIRIRARERVSLENGGQISTQTAGTLTGGSISIETGAFETRVTHPGVGATGLPVVSRGLVVTTSSGEADSGSIAIEASEGIDLVFGEVFSEIAGSGGGRPGAIDLSTPEGTVDLRQGSFVTVRSGDGLGRPIRIEADRLELSEGSFVQSFSDGDAKAGDLELNVREIRIDGGGDAARQAGLTSRPIGSNLLGTGAGGTIRIEGESLQVLNEGVISLTSGEAGAAGDLIVGETTPLARVEVDGGRIESDNFGIDAPGGRIEINAREIQLRNGAQITAVNRGSSLPGSIELVGEDLRVESGGVITSGSNGNEGVGGDIQIRMTESVLTERGRISTDAAGASPANRGGNIEIESGVLILAASAIEADAPAGAGGNVQIVSGRFLQSTDSAITATGSSTALEGTVRLISGESNSVEAVSREARAVEDVTRRLASRCDARTESRGSFFVRTLSVEAPPGEARMAEVASRLGCGRME